MSPARLLPSERYPADETGVTARFVTLTSGLRLRVVESGPPDGSPVLLLHGWGGSAYQFRKNIGPLVALGRRTMAVDLPGHGLSDKPRDPDFYSLEVLVRVVVDLLDALGLDRAAVVGQSLGGAVAVRLALDHPSRVERLALVSSVGITDAWGVSWGGRLLPAVLSAVMPRLALRVVFHAVLWMAYGRPARPTSRDVDEAWAATSDDAYPRALLHLVRGFHWRAPTADELSALRAPLLVICGERDRIASPRRLGRRLGRLMRSRAEVIPDGGHAVNEGNPDAVNVLLADFLDNTVAQDATKA